jgi:hypothetical protein
MVTLSFTLLQDMQQLHFWEQLWQSSYCDLYACSTKNQFGQTASDILYDRGETYWAYNICPTMLCLNKGIKQISQIIP